ncbi:MAG: phosphatidylserine decarboxylase [candidate division Zixibacteria bacterium]|nr:phosphatidylserine decarboxylase [candidate division Zixibacteria bacterium]
MAREGFIFFLPFVVIAVIFFYLFNRYTNMAFIYLGVISFVLACAFILFFRDPVRKIPAGDDLIVSPADGKILNIVDTGDQTVITIFLSILDVHINRIPVNGKVVRLKYKPGKFLAAFREAASDVNERFEIEISTDKGNVTVHQIAGVLARRVVCRLKDNQTVVKGDRFGMIRFGSRVDLFIPGSSRVDVKKGDKVKGGETIMGKLL